MGGSGFAAPAMASSLSVLLAPSTRGRKIRLHAPKSKKSASLGSKSPRDREREGMKRRARALFLVLSTGVPACGEVGVHLGHTSPTTGGVSITSTSSEAEADTSITSTGSETDVTTSIASSSESESGDPQSPEDGFFGCEREDDWNTCETIYWHIDPGPAAARECSARYVAGNQPALLHGLRSFGPDIDETEWLVAVAGEDTALVSRRDRSCVALGSGDCSGEVPWTYQALQICELRSREALLTCFGNCADPDDCDCGWDPFSDEFLNCVDAPAFGCAALDGFLGDGPDESETASTDGVESTTTSGAEGGIDTEPTTGDPLFPEPCEHDTVDDCCCFSPDPTENDETMLDTTCEHETLCSLEVICDFNGDGVIDASDDVEDDHSVDPLDCPVSALLPEPRSPDGNEQVTCALEALATGQIGRVHYEIGNYGNPGWSGRVQNVYLAGDRTAFMARDWYEDLGYGYEPPLRVELHPPAYFEACAAQEAFADRFACVAAPYASVTNACW